MRFPLERAAQQPADAAARPFCWRNPASISGEYCITLLPEAIWLKVEGFGEGRVAPRPSRNPKDLSQMDRARRVCRWRAPSASGRT